MTVLLIYSNLRKIVVEFIKNKSISLSKTGILKWKFTILVLKIQELLVGIERRLL